MVLVLRDRGALPRLLRLGKSRSARLASPEMQPTSDEWAPKAPGCRADPRTGNTRVLPHTKQDLESGPGFRYQ